MKYFIQIILQITAETTGWVGIGFSPTGSMTNADIIMAWVTDGGTTHLLVRQNNYSSGFQSH